MSAVKMAMASRQSAILALVAGLHVGASMLAAAGLLPRLLEGLPQASVITVLPRALEPAVRLLPVAPAPADFAPPPVPLPDIGLPPDVAATGAPAAVAGARDAAGGDGASGPPALHQPPALRIRDSRLMALIGACYPAAARRTGEAGRAVASVVVDPRGGVASWSLLQGTGFPRLDSAIDCVIRRLEFDPGRRDGIAVTAELLLPVVFRLN